MRTNNHLAISCGLLLLASTSSFSAPPLQVHVYEENLAPVQKTPAVVIDEAVQPDRLRVHIYERKPKLSSQEGHRALAAVHQDEPLVSYNGVDFLIGAGIRRDKLFGEQFHSSQISADLTVHLANNWFVSGRAAYADVRTGKVIDDGNLYDASLSFGKMFARQSLLSLFDRVEWRPQLGYSYHEQDVNIEATGLDINTKWHGPWFGGSATLIQDDKFAVGLNLAYHYAFVDGEVEYQNLRLSEDARANGFTSKLFTNWNVSSNFAIKLDVSSQYWKTNSSAEEELKWKNLGAEVGLEYQF